MDVRAIPASNPRAVAAFLKEVRQLSEEVNTRRKVWIRDFGGILRDAREGVEGLASRAEIIGQEQLASFRVTLEHVDALAVPDAGGPCHSSLRIWLDKEIAACEALIEAGRANEMDQLRIVHGLFGEARMEMRRFQMEFAALVGALKNRIEESRKAPAAAARPASRWSLRGRARQKAVS